MRVGTGFDVHALVEGRPLILGAVHIPNARGLLGHSDADVLLHALMDALLGAAGKGDIGRHFPDSDPCYQGISSLWLLERVMEILREEGLGVANIDCTIIAQGPRLAGYIPEMAAKIAPVLGVDLSQVNIKATTTERLGFTGRGEGIAAQAVVLCCYIGETGAAGKRICCRPGKS